MIDKILNGPILRIIGYVFSLSIGVTVLLGGGNIGSKLMGGFFILTGLLALLREIIGLVRGPQNEKR